MTICNNRLFRFLICLFLCVAIIFGQVAIPFAQQTLTLTIPASAIAGVDDVACFIILTVLMSAFSASISNPEQSYEIGKQIYENFTGNCKYLVDQAAEQAHKTWDGVSSFIEMSMNYDDYNKMVVEMALWLNEHMSSDGKYLVLGGTDASGFLPLSQWDYIAYDSLNWLDNGRVFLQYPSDCAEIFKHAVYDYTGTPFAFSNSYIGTDFNVVRGQPHSFYIFPFENKEYHPDPPLYHFKFGYSNPTNGGTKWAESDTLAYRAFLVPLIRSDGSHILSIATITYKKGSYYLGFLENDEFIELDHGFFDVLSSSSGAVSIPIETDEDYANGAVVSAWDSVIGRVGAAAENLPFNVPMTEEGLGSMTVPDIIPDILEQEIGASTDIPVDDVGEIEIPKVADLALPDTIVKKFPFCLPMDLIRVIGLFAHAPVTPSWVIPFQYGDIIDVSFTLDFHYFEDVIKVVRAFETIFFVVGLILVTRKMIKW